MIEGGGSALLEEAGRQLNKQCVGELLHLSTDRADIRLTAKACSQLMSKRVKGRMLHGIPVMLQCVGPSQAYHQVLEWASRPVGVHPGEGWHAIFSDSDWAQGRRTTWEKYASRNQGVVAQSSAEAEVYAAATAVIEALLIQQVYKFMRVGGEVGPALRLRIDSDAGRGVLQQQGCGNTEHLDCNFLWVQKLVKNSLL